MSRGVRGGGASLGELCRKCGADEWRFERNGKGSRSRRCVPCARARAREDGRRAQHKDPPAYLWRNARSRARRGGVPFTITPADVRAVWPVDGKCPALGIELRPGVRTVRDESPSLDRINDGWGYEPGNVAVISFRANRAKSTLRAAELERLAAWMRSHGLS